MNTKEVTFATKTESDIPTYICDTLSRRSPYNDDPFIVANVSELQDRYQKWKTFFPSIQPFFALKSQDNFFSRSIFAANGAGFDVSSLNEIEEALDSGVSADHIIFAQPYKQMEHLIHALKKGILTVCDTVDELRKVGEVAEELAVKASVLIRILPGVNDEKMNIGIPLSSKFGAPLSLLSDLSSVAIEYGIAVKGISFHVGSQCYTLKAYTKTLQLARTWWNILEGQGFTLSVLDIGGGFPQDIFENHPYMANKINLAIEKNFADIRASIRVIAEPGRCMVSSSMSVVTQVLTVKLSNAHTHSYVLNTGVYGALNTTLTDPSAKSTVPYVILKTDKTKFNVVSDCRQFIHDKKENGPKCKSLILYGPTCDGQDTLLPCYKIPVDLKRGDAIVFPNLGAYTTSLMTSFNGFNIPVVHYVYTDRHAETIEKILGV